MMKRGFLQAVFARHAARKQMKIRDNYPALSNLIGAYLNQDYSIYADTIEGVIDCFLSDSNHAEKVALRHDIARFLQNERNGYDASFAGAYSFDFDPKLWGLTTETFLRQLDAQVAAALH